MTRKIVTAILGVLFMTGPASGQTTPKNDPLADGFLQVPMEARMRMYWRVFGPAWTPVEIDSQLALLKAAGVGGVMTYFFYPVAIDNPAKGIHNQRFLSPEFLDTFAYAARRAGALGLRFGVSGGTGWPYGGPTVTAHEAAQRLRREIVTPTDGGGYRLPTLGEGERYVAAFQGEQDVTAALRNNAGFASSKTPLQLFISGPTGMQVKRPAFGGEGRVLDHYSRTAAEHYLDTVVAPLLRAASGAVQSLFCDSLEVYASNWTHDFPEQFRARRGYDLLPHLPALFDDHAPDAPDLRCDFWRTLAETTEESFTQTVGDWSRKHGLSLELEAYGTPPNPLTAARYIDLPTGEQYEWEGFSLSRLAASGAHLTGKRVIGAEAWTWTNIPNRLVDTLSDLKLASDIHFLAGANDITGVDFPYSPREAGAPGWLPYYGPAFNDNNPQWPFFHYLVDYLNRCQWMLRQGQPVADVALYLPVEDSFASGPTDQMLLGFRFRDHFVSGEVTDEFGLRGAFRHHSDLIHNLITHGHNYDGIDLWAIDRLAKVRSGQLVVGDGRYSVVVLPNLVGIDPKALEKIARFCREGGTVIATQRLPKRAYGLPGTHNAGREATVRVRTLIAEMFGAEVEGASSTVHGYGWGRACFVPDERDSWVRQLAALPADVSLTPYQPTVGFVHRQAGHRNLYFLANVGDQAARFDATFRVSGKNPSLWNPLDGTITPLPTRAAASGCTTVSLRLPPRGSTFVVFKPGSPRNAVAGTTPNSAQDEEVAESTSITPALSAWHVTFDGPDAPTPRETDILTSWTAWPDARFFSGLATYTTTLRWDGALPKRCYLHFEQIREAAEITVNNRRAGVLWTPPSELDVAPFLHAGDNTLSITVANLPVNRFLGQPDPDLKSLRAVYGNRFPAPEEKQLMKEPAPSGLIGAVTLRVVRAGPQ